MKISKPISILILILSATLIIGLISNVQAQESSGGFAGSFSRMGFSPRGMAMGNAMTSVIQEGSYSYYNPAFAALKSDDIQVDAGTAILSFDRQLNMVHSHFQLPPSAGLSLSMVHGSVGDIDGRNLSGYHTGTLSTNEFQILGNFGLRFSESFSAGIGFKYNIARYHPEIPLSTGLGIDVGVLIRLIPKLRFGITVQDLLASYRFNTSDLYGTNASDLKQLFPIRIISGLSYQINRTWLISADLEHRRHSYENGSARNDQDRGDLTATHYFLRSGTSYQLHERFTLRAGFQLNDLGNENDFQPTAGFSIHLPYDTLSPSIDYAYLSEPSGMSTMHVFAIRFNL